MTVSAATLASLGLYRTHELRRHANGRLRFELLDGAHLYKDASVYLWGAQGVSGGDSVEPLYVGKAGRGIAARLREHEAGFVHSGTGRANAELLGRTLDMATRVVVFTRKSARTQLFGQTVSLYAAEEDALCQLLQPSINRAAFPPLLEAAA